MGSYVPSTSVQQKEMLAAIGCSSCDDLFADIPKSVRLTGDLILPDTGSELGAIRQMESIAEKNVVFKSIFRGAGAYHHYIPAIVQSITSKEEFVTAYTPYQAEISQGLLQWIFEYQTEICELTGMAASNASVYDGATATAEAAGMCREKARTKTLVSAAMHPQVIETMKTYCFSSDSEMILIPLKDGLTDTEALQKMLDDTVACVCIEQPNFFGLIENAELVGSVTHTAGSKFIMNINPIAAALLKTPGECGADIAVGEGQPLGLPLSFGGPYLGFMACTEKLLRRLPGRVVGETTDVDGKRAYVLTLQAREQHIRREKASSNICSNQALCALTASVYMATMGANGLRETAVQCYSKAHYLCSKLEQIVGFERKFSSDYFHEFVTNCPIEADALMKFLEQHNILGGYPTKEGILWCVTEMNTKEQIDKLVEVLSEVKPA